MSLNRRNFLQLTPWLFTGGVVWGPSVARSRSADTAPLPDPGTFESGDFIWPKKPNVYVPYHAGATALPEQDEAQWEQEKEQFLHALETQSTHLSEEDVRDLRNLDYRAFYSIYAGDQQPEAFVGYSTGGGVYVGHVGILELDDQGTPWVVEALYRRGVIRQPYAKWLEDRPGEIVWHGRLRDLDEKERARIARESKEYLERPYNFWNFDLNDDADFYCSKLVWLSVFRSLGMAVDGNSDPKRKIWFSPKQLLNAESVVRLHNPAEY